MSRVRESESLLDEQRIPLEDRAGEPQKSDKFNFKEFFTQHGVLLFYVIMAILVGTANRVTFRLMQYSMMNYGYFISQVTTFIYLPVNFVVVMIKLLFTDHITPEMLEFPKWKFIVMGFFDSLQGLLIVVGGLYVPGIMQNLLLQGSVPVTMFFSLLMLRSSGDVISRVARNILYNKRIQFVEEYAGDDAVEEAQADKSSVCRLTVNGKDMGNIPAILANEAPPNPELEWFGPSCVRACSSEKKSVHGGSGSIQGGLEVDDVTLFGGSSPADLMGAKVVLTTDAHTWGAHFRNYYSIAQYAGAAVIMAGLVASVWPSLSQITTDKSTIVWELIFFSSTIPIAISGVYKEIAFNSVDDMDVWYLNGYVAVYQFLLGLTYAPLAAIMTDLAIADIPSNIWQGTQCWLLGQNFVTRANGYDCSVQLGCGTGGNPMCCDSCDGSIHSISSLPALWGVCLYMVANIAYNVFLVLVIKHGSAALMYATSTVVLPLGSIAFTIPLFLGAHAVPFDVYTGAGLGVVLFGLIIYRFGDLLLRNHWAKKREEQKASQKLDTIQ